MQIFVDEAGLFVIPQSREWSASCVGALVVRDADVAPLHSGFLAIKKSWGVGECEEVKGSRLGNSGDSYEWH